MNIICTNIVVFKLVLEKDIAHTFKYKQNPSPIACPRQDFLGHSNAQVNELIVSNFTTLWSLCGLSPTLCVRKIWLGLRSNPLETLKTTTIRCARNHVVSICPSTYTTWRSLQLSFPRRILRELYKNQTTFTAQVVLIRPAFNCRSAFSVSQFDF